MADESSRIILRSDLYDEIWTINATSVAKKYNIPYQKLLTICKDYTIPVPQAGYWTKLSYGKTVERTALPTEDDVEIDLVYESLRSRRKKVARHVVPSNRTSEKSKPPKENAKSNEASEPIIPYKLVHGINNIYNREKLYEEIWSKPVIEIADQYGVSDVTIIKVCKSLDVPVPPRGYWAKVRSGEKVTKPHLKPTSGSTSRIGPRTYEGNKFGQEKIKNERLAFLDDSEKQLVLMAADEISLSDDGEPFHKKLNQYKSKILRSNDNDQESEGPKKKHQPYSNRPSFLIGVVSESAVPRALRILNALFCQIEQLGGSINTDFTLKIRNETVSISFKEYQDQVDHVMTKQEAKELLVYKDANRHHSYASKPQIRKYDYIYNGRLGFQVIRGRHFRDSNKSDLESQLGDILVNIFEVSEIERVERLAREEAERKRLEEARLKEERRNRYNLEVERTIALENEASDYTIACRIRAYAGAVEKNIDPDDMTDETRQWIEWAMKKADWYDPTIARNDEIFGEREHEKSADQKSLKKSGYYW
jgi:hypothetical protein